MLSCDCPSYNESDWYYLAATDFSVLETKRGRRCRSCNCLIAVGSCCLIFDRERWAADDIEFKIYGDDPIEMAPWYHCEKCGEIFLNLEAAGYCLNPSDNMAAALKEYWELTGFNKEQTATGPPSRGAGLAQVLKKATTYFRRY